MCPVFKDYVFISNKWGMVLCATDSVGKYWETDVTYSGLDFFHGIWWKSKKHEVTPALSFKGSFGFWGIFHTIVRQAEGLLYVSAYSLNIWLNSELSLLCSIHKYQPLKCWQTHCIQGLIIEHLFPPVIFFSDKKKYVGYVSWAQ